MKEIQTWENKDWIITHNPNISETFSWNIKNKYLNAYVLNAMSAKVIASLIKLLKEVKI